MTNHRRVRGLGWVSLHMIARIGWLRRIGTQRNNRGQVGIRVRLSISGVPRWLKVKADVILGNLVVRLVWAEKQAYNWHLKQTVVEDVNLHSCARRHHEAFNTGSKCQCQIGNSMKITTVLDAGIL